MKKFFLFLIISMIFIAGIFSFVLYKVWFSNDISISVNDSENRLQLYASYPRSKTARIQHLLDSRFHCAMLRHRRSSGYVTMEDNAQVFIKTMPGRFEIKLNKDENSRESYFMVKQLGDDIKIALTRNN